MELIIEDRNKIMKLNKIKERVNHLIEWNGMERNGVNWSVCFFLSFSVSYHGTVC